MMFKFFNNTISSDDFDNWFEFGVTAGTYFILGLGFCASLALSCICCGNKPQQEMRINQEQNEGHTDTHAETTPILHGN